MRSNLVFGDFGALYGVNSLAAASVNSAALSAYLLACASGGVNAVIPVGELFINPLIVSIPSGELSVDCHATLINQLGGTATQPLLQVCGTQLSDIKWRGGRFNENGGAFSCLEVRDWRSADVHVDEAAGITCTPASTNSTSGVVFSNVRVGKVSWTRMHSMGKGTNTQGSLPRCFSVSQSDGLRSDCDVDMGRCENVHGMIVVGAMAGGAVNTYRGIGRNVDDNGIYNVGDASVVSCHDINVDNIDELFVNSGSGELNAYRPILRNGRNAIGLQSCKAVNIYDGDLEFVPGVGPFKTRPANVASGSLLVKGSRIRCRPSGRVLDFGTSGTIEQFVDSGNRWEIEIDEAIQASVTLFALSPGARCRIDSDSDWIFVDAPGGAATTDVLFFNIPTVTELSRWERPPVVLLSQAAAGVRFNSARQRLFAFNGQYSVGNLQSEREANFPDKTASPPREVWGSGAPTTGYWQLGSRVWNISPIAGGDLGWVCVAPGSPGTWKIFGSISS